MLGAHEADMAATLLDLADGAGSDRVGRDRVRAEWAADHPEHTVRVAVARHGGGHAPELGRVGRRRILSALTALEQHGMIRRDGDATVEITDRAALAQLADS